MESASRIVLTLAALVISVIFHEQMHARVAYWLGDPTGKNDNRFSWNPIHHIDPVMTILLPLILLITTKGGFCFGGAKPVSINALNFKNPSLGMCLSAAAGPLSNFFLASVGFGLLALLARAAPGVVMADGLLTWNGFFFVMFIYVNVLLGAFNLIPIPPLDGSSVVRHLAPREVQAVMDSVEPFGLIVIMALMYLGAGVVLLPVIDLYVNLLASAAGPAFASAAIAVLFR